MGVGQKAGARFPVWAVHGDQWCSDSRQFNETMNSFTHSLKALQELMPSIAGCVFYLSDSKAEIMSLDYGAIVALKNARNGGDVSIEWRIRRSS